MSRIFRARATPVSAPASAAAPASASALAPTSTGPRSPGPAKGSAAGLPVSAAAVMQQGYGGPEVLQLTERPLPKISDGEVLVEVRAAGLARGAWHMMTGTPYLLRAVFGLRRPRQPVMGHNLAGTVVAVGPAVTRFHVGDKVYGIGRGTFAHFAAAREEKLAAMPSGLSFEQAAAVPVSGLTALQALDAAGVTAGQKVLVLGASGGVGSFAVQMAKSAGAEVTGACSGAKADFVRSLGADHVLDYSREDFARGPRYDAVIDVGGSPSPVRLRRALLPDGTAVLAGGEEGGRLTGGMFERQAVAAVLSLVGRRRLKGLMCTESGSDLERITALIEAETVVPRIDSRYPLAEVAGAMRRLEAGEVRGSVVLTVEGSG